MLVQTDTDLIEAGEDSWACLGQQIQAVHPKGSQLNIHWKGWSWSANPLATWWEELTHWQRPWCWERLKAGGEGDDREWDGWTVSLTQWTWVWANSGDGEGQGSHGVTKSDTTRLSDWTTTAIKDRGSFKEKNVCDSGLTSGSPKRQWIILANFHGVNIPTVSSFQRDVAWCCVEKRHAQ